MIIQLIHLSHPSNSQPGSFIFSAKSLNDLTDPRLAAKERAKRPNQMTADLFSEENRGLVNDTLAAEVTYEVRFSFII